MDGNKQIPEIKNSRVVKLYDYHLSEIPEDCRLWRVKDEEINEKLAQMAARRISMSAAEIVKSGDGVRCTCVDGTSLHGRKTVLLYPGHQLVGANIADGDVLGKNVGSAFTTEIDGEKLCLRVEEILRKGQIPPITDDLVKNEGLPGVDNIESYARRYREIHEPDYRKRSISQVASFWFQETGEKSELYIDEDEQNAYASAMAKQIYDDMLKCGIDPRIPDDGTDILTEEEAINQYKESMISEFRYILVQQAIIESKSLGEVSEEDIVNECRKEVEQSGMTEEEYLGLIGCTHEEFTEQKRDDIPTERMWESLKKEAEAYVEA